MVGQRQEPLGQRPVQSPRELFGRVVSMRVEIGPTGVADQQRIACKNEPRFVAADVIGNEIGVVGERVARRGDRLDRGVAQADRRAVRQRMMLELHVCPRGEVTGRTRPRHELG